MGQGNNLVANAVWRAAPFGEWHPFAYDYGNKFGPYTLEVYSSFYPQNNQTIHFGTILAYFLVNSQAIGAFNLNNSCVVLIYPDYQETIELDARFNKPVSERKTTFYNFKETIPEVHEQLYVGFKRTRMIAEDCAQPPIRMCFDLEDFVYSDDLPGITTAKSDPPMSLFNEMNERKAEYAFIASNTGEHIFLNERKEKIC